MTDKNDLTPILRDKLYTAPSAFKPESLLREARRQKGLANDNVPGVCLLDPDGDIVRRLRETAQAKCFGSWPCYHTELDIFTLGKHEVGIVGRVVGASFAVLVAEELFASGCKLLVSLTSTGRIMLAGEPPYFVLIDRALRDEGTSYHYARRRNLRKRTRRWWRRPPRPWRPCLSTASSDRAGRRMRHSAKPPRQLTRIRLEAFSPSKWKPPRSTLSHASVTRRCFVLPM